MPRHQTVLLTLASLLSSAILATGAAGQDVRLDMATVDANSQPAKFMTTFARIASSNVEGVQINVYTDGVDTLDTISLSRGLLDMSMISPVTHDLMTNAAGMYAAETVAAELSKAVKLLLWFPRGQFHFAVRNNSEILTLNDIKGAKVYLGPHIQSAAFHDVQSWIAATSGLIAGQHYEAVVDTWDLGAAAFLSGDVDVFVTACLEPCRRLKDLSGSADLRFIGPSGANGAEVKAFFQPGRSPTETQSEMKNGNRSGSTVHSFQTVAGIAVYDATDDQLVYDITKAFWENSNQASTDQVWAQQLDMTYATTKRGRISLHPGAAKYYD